MTWISTKINPEHYGPFYVLVPTVFGKNDVLVSMAVFDGKKWEDLILKKKVIGVKYWMEIPELPSDVKMGISKRYHSS